MKKNKAFTLIELIAVLVILAVIALIVTPLVLRIIDNAKNNANQRSVDGYGKSIEIALANYLLDHDNPPTSIDELDVKYTGVEVKCGIQKLNDDGTIYLSRCTADGVIVKSNKTEDGYYHYGKIEMGLNNYVDMYGKAIDEALIKYQEKNGSLPSDISELTIDYSGKKISCDSTINSDATVYLTKCSVEDEKVLDVNTSDGYYHYGTKLYKRDYKIGDVVTYNNMKFYVIENSFDTTDSIKLLKATPLTVDEVNTYGYGHVNQNAGTGIAYDNNGYGGMAYYTSDTCYPYGSSDTSGCTTDYDASDVKYAVDEWSNAKFKDSDLREDENGYKARLITRDEFLKISSYSWAKDFGISSAYWTMTPSRDLFVYVIVNSQGLDDIVEAARISASSTLVRPVVILSKEAITQEE